MRTIFSQEKLDLANQSGDPRVLASMSILKPIDERVLYQASALIRRNAPLTVRTTKVIALHASNLSTNRWAEQRALLGPVFSSEDAYEGAAAFAERCEPKWKGSLTIYRRDCGGGKWRTVIELKLIRTMSKHSPAERDALIGQGRCGLSRCSTDQPGSFSRCRRARELLFYALVERCDIEPAAVDEVIFIERAQRKITELLGHLHSCEVRHGN